MTVQIVAEFTKQTYQISHFLSIINSFLPQRKRRLTLISMLFINEVLVPHKSKFKVVLNYSSDAVSLFDSPLCGTRCAEKSVGTAHAAACTAQWVSPDLRAEYIKYLVAFDRFSHTQCNVITFQAAVPNHHKRFALITACMDVNSLT